MTASGSRSRLRSAGLSLCASVFAAGLSPQAHASDGDDAFYKGKTINFVIAAPPGGGYDLAARLVSRYLGRFIPGQPGVVPQNMPGAGGFRVANFLASGAPRDGLTIGIHTRGIIQAPMLGDPSARFDSVDFSWVGTISSGKNDAYLLVVNKNSGVRSIEDMRRATTPVTLGSVGGITTNVIFALLSPSLFAFNTRLVTGYDGSAGIMLALMRGEVNGAYIGLGSLTGPYQDAMKSGELVPVLQLARTTPHPDFPNLPMSTDLVTEPDAKALLAFVESLFLVAYPVSGPPGVPEDRLRLLQAAFMQATSDPGYLVEADKLGIDASALGGEDVRKIIIEMKKTPPAVIDKYKDLLASKAK